jgi:hypothetical protein
MANVIEKSVEIQKLENAAALFAKMLREVLGDNVKARINFEGINPIVLRGLSESLVDSEGDNPQVKIWNCDVLGKSAYIMHTIEGDGFEINQFSE